MSRKLDSGCVLVQHLGVLGPKHVSNPQKRSLIHTLFMILFIFRPSIDLVRAPYVLYGVKYIDLVSPAIPPPGLPSPPTSLGPVNLKLSHHPPLGFQNGLQANSGVEMCFDIGSQHLARGGQNTSLYAQGCGLS